MQWLQAITQQFSQHKYAINAKQLGDHAELPWSNLGYWDDATSSYPEACRQLADHLAQALQLSSQDKLLDLGCGQGASLLFWQQYYHIEYIEAVELQTACVNKIQTYLPHIHAIHRQSFLNLNQISFNNHFDVVLCIDAAYHSNLNSFLDSVNTVLNSNARLGFHYLILSEKWFKLSSGQKQKYKWLLKAADIHLDYLMSQSEVRITIQNYGFKEIEIVDLSYEVLHGFSDYIQQSPQNTLNLDAVKIQMTAKLCHTLYTDGLIQYVQICAQKKLSE